MRKKSALSIKKGWLQGVEHSPTSHFTPRELGEAINLLVVHNISLPPGEFGGSYITDLFMGRLDKEAHPYFAEIYQLEVSAHCLIQRDGNIIQYVSFDDKAWHAGVSCYQGRERCNDFSIGVELEGTDELAYTQAQYQVLAELTAALLKTYPEIKDNIVGHCDVAPGRKTDPGEAFDWPQFQTLLKSWI